MIAAELLDQIQKHPVTDYAGFEDFSDKFNFVFTVLTLMMCNLIVITKQYIVKPINCYLANNIGGVNLLSYVENYCWVKGTIPISLSDNLPDTHEKWNELEHKKLLYYQWVPFVLGLQTVLFYLPHMFWQMICQNRSGTDMHHIMSMVSDAMKSNQRNVYTKQIAQTLCRMLSFSIKKESVHRRRARKVIKNVFSWTFANKNSGSFLFFMYLIIKVLYLVNSIGQIFLIERLITSHQNKNNGSSLVGFRLAQESSTHQIESNAMFPTVGYCLVRLRLHGSINLVAAQCSLPVNMLNEKIYVFLWFWFCVCAALIIISIPMWLRKMFSGRSHFKLIENHLKFQEIDSSQEKALMDKFIRKYMRNDGIFLVSMIQENSNAEVTGDVLKQMWQIFLNDKKIQEDIDFVENEVDNLVLTDDRILFSSMIRPQL